MPAYLDNPASLVKAFSYTVWNAYVLKTEIYSRNEAKDCVLRQLRPSTFLHTPVKGINKDVGGVLLLFALNPMGHQPRLGRPNLAHACMWLGQPEERRTW